MLIVEDHADTARTLAGCWAQAFVALDGPTALDQARRCSPEVALIDISLPGMDGYEVARLLREQAPRIRLIALTGHDRSEYARHSQDIGIEHHLVKPFDLDRLRELIGRG
jgi:CheY-like chemotaxis protein